jgi:hypothetical protein
VSPNVDIVQEETLQNPELSPNVDIVQEETLQNPELSHKRRRIDANVSLAKFFDKKHAYWDTVISKLDVDRCKDMLLWQPSLNHDAQSVIMDRMATIMFDGEPVNCECLRSLTDHPCCAMLVERIKNSIGCVSLLLMSPPLPESTMTLVKNRLTVLLNL